MPFQTLMPPLSYRPGPTAVEPRSDAPLILVADDHDDSRYIARLVLENGGFRVLEARNGSQALALARLARPDAMILDIVMPEMTGWQVARALRGDADSLHLPIIAVTALSGSADRELSLASGCDEMLVKPVHPRVLVQVVRRHLAQRALTHAG